MWAIRIEQGAEIKLSVGQSEVPKLNSGNVLIRTHAFGLNRADIFQKQGLYPPPTGASDILGLEVSGIVEEIGDHVTTFKKGDKVCALLEGGGYAEYVSVASSQVLPIPNNLNFIQAAALPEALFTAYSNMFLYADLHKGDSLLMHGGASGLGTFVVQLAKVFGINCYTTAGSAEKCTFLEELGAKKAINYKTEDFVEEIKKLSASGMDCVIDIVGGDYFARNLRILGKNGKMICLSFLKGAKIEANLAPLLYKNLTVMGATLRSKSLENKGDIALSLRGEVWPLLLSGAIKPVIDSVYELNDINQAHQRMEDGLHIGKIILKCD